MKSFSEVDFMTHWIRRAIWLQEEGQSVFIVDVSRSLEEIEEFSLTIVQLPSLAKWNTAYKYKYKHEIVWKMTPHAGISA